MNTKTENTEELNFEEIEKASGGTELEAVLFMKHLFKKYGTTKLREIKNLWTPEEHDFFDRAYKRKAGEEPLGPYPD